MTSSELTVPRNAPSRILRLYAGAFGTALDHLGWLDLNELLAEMGAKGSSTNRQSLEGSPSAGDGSGADLLRMEPARAA